MHTLHVFNEKPLFDFSLVCLPVNERENKKLKSKPNKYSLIYICVLLAKWVNINQRNINSVIFASKLEIYKFIKMVFVKLYL